MRKFSFQPYVGWVDVNNSTKVRWSAVLLLVMGKMRIIANNVLGPTVMHWKDHFTILGSTNEDFIVGIKRRRI
jgi:hypothetical protein